jgi:glycosyltransferase involved in cell wall biosynthesis
VDAEHTKADLEEFHPGTARKTVAIPLGVSERFSEPEHVQEEGRTVLGTSHVEPYLLYVGSLKPHKNVATLLKAFRSLSHPELRLLLVGESLERRPELIDLVFRLKLRDRVKSIGWVADEDLLRLYRGALALVMPSRYEGFGLPVLEAMACGTPVVCSRAASLPEVVGEAGLLFEPDDADELRHQLEKLLWDRTVHADLRRKGIHQAGKFTWRRCVEQTLAVYRSVAAA